MKAKQMSKARAANYLALGIFLASLCHFMLFVTGIVPLDLQLDFASLYAAGTDLNLGLDPYVNHITENLKLGDSFAPFQASRFLYPPLAGSIFQPLALLPYGTAKEIWTGFTLFCLILSVALQAEVLGCQFSRQIWLLIGAAILLFFPLIAELERGQVDALCLLMLSLSLYCALRDQPKNFRAGMFLALASLFKLHCGLVLLYLLLKKQFKFAFGFCVAWAILLIASVTMYGWQLQYKYLTVDMPRIAKYACYGTEAMRVDPLIMGANNQGVTPGFVRVQGVDYAIEALRINPLASLPFYLKVLLGSKFTFGTWALITASFIFCLVVLKELTLGGTMAKPETLLSNYVFWQIALMSVLLSGPLTWVMNSVWLTPLIPFCFYYFSQINSRTEAKGWTLLVLGLLVSGFPDESGGLHDIIFTYVFYLFKPIVGEVLCFIGLLRIYYSLRASEIKSHETHGEGVIKPAG